MEFCLKDSSSVWNSFNKSYCNPVCFCYESIKSSVFQNYKALIYKFYYEMISWFFIIIPPTHFTMNWSFFTNTKNLCSWLFVYKYLIYGHNFLSMIFFFCWYSWLSSVDKHNSFKFSTLSPLRCLSCKNKNWNIESVNVYTVLLLQFLPHYRIRLIA